MYGCWIRLLSCGLLVGAGLVVGCGGNDSVKAIPRPTSNAPVLHSQTIGEEAAGNSYDLSFLNESHFACFGLNIRGILAVPNFVDVPWDFAENALAEWVGVENARLDKIDRAWLVLDRAILNVSADKPGPSWILVLDYQASFEIQPLVKSEDRDPVAVNGSPNDNSESPIVANQISDHRIIVGDPELTRTIGGEESATGLSTRLRQMKLDVGVVGVVSIGPIRNMLNSGFEMALAMGGDAVRPFAKLPELVERIEFQVDFESDQLILVNINIEDEQVAGKLASLLDGGGSGSSFPMNGMGMLGRGPQQPTQMLPNASAEWLEKIAIDIQANHLFSVTADEQLLTLGLKRPGDLDQLVRSMIVDWDRQVGLTRRVENFEAVGAALRMYVEENGCLPPAGIVKPGEGELPPQFCWRVGLLPYIGEQELYDRFDFDQPFDSESNLKTAKDIPEVFAVDNATKEDAILTRIQVVGGEGGLFSNSVGRVLADVTDPLASMALVIEGAQESAVVWTSPGAMKIGGELVDRMGRGNENGVLIVNGKFKTRIVKKENSIIRAALSPSGGERLKRSDFLAMPTSSSP